MLFSRSEYRSSQVTQSKDPQTKNHCYLRDYSVVSNRGIKYLEVYKRSLVLRSYVLWEEHGCLLNPGAHDLGV